MLVKAADASASAAVVTECIVDGQEILRSRSLSEMRDQVDLIRRDAMQRNSIDALMHQCSRRLSLRRHEASELAEVVWSVVEEAAFAYCAARPLKSGDCAKGVSSSSAPSHGVEQEWAASLAVPDRVHGVSTETAASSQSNADPRAVSTRGTSGKSRRHRGGVSH